MPAILTAEAIIFSINSAIKLSQNIRRAYAHSLRARTLALPLPDYSSDISLDRVIDFFDDNPHYCQELPLLQDLQRKAEDDVLTPEENADYYQYFNAFFSFHESGEHQKQPEAGPEDLVNLFRIRQWERGKEPASVLQLVAGSLVEIGIDFFLHTQGALNRDSALGKAMFHFLDAFDEIDFADNPDIKKDFSRHLLPRLFAAGAETLSELSPEITGDRKTQEFIKATAHGIANDIYRRANDMNAFQRADAVQWGQVVLRSMISNAGTYVFNAPQAFFNTNQPMSEIIGQSGLLLLDAILDDDSDKVVFRKALSPETLDKLSRATLQVVAEHPNLISSNHGIKQIISGVAGAVQQEEFLSLGFLPELTRIVLEQSAGSLPLLWKESPQGPSHLLVIAIQETLRILSQKPQDAVWRPAFTKTSLLSVLEEVLEDVVSNPAWITDEVRGRPVLSAVMDATFSALNTIPKGERINADVLQWLIRNNLEVALTSRAVLDTVKWGGDQMEKPILQKGLELVFSFVFPPDGPPAVHQLSLLSSLLDYVMEAVLKQHPNENGLILVDLILFNSGIDYSQGFNPQLADQLVDAALQAMASQPALLAKPEAVRNILAGVAGALDSARLKQPALLPRLVQLVLENTALNTQLIIEAGQGQPRHLLVTALTQILQALAATDDSGQWRPGISTAQAEHLIDSLLDEVVQYPQWVTDKVNQDTLLAEVLDTTFLALAGIPSEHRLSPETIDQLIQLNLRTVASSPLVLKKVKWGGDQHEKAILLQALELVFAFTFPTDNTGTTAGRMFLLTALLDYVTEAILQQHPNENGLILVDLILFNSGIDYSQGFNPQLADQLVDAALQAMASQPALLAKPEAVRNILAGVAGALDSARLKQPALLPRLVQLVLENTALNAQLIIEAGQGQPRHLLVTALTQILQALAATDDSGQWRPGISPAQAEHLIDSLLDEVVQYPQWVTDKVNQDSLLAEVLDTTFLALAGIPVEQRLQPGAVEQLIQLNLRTVASSPQVLKKVKWGGDQLEKGIMLRALELVFAFTFPAGNTGTATGRAFLLLGLMDYTLEVLLSRHPNKKGLILVNLILSEDNGIDYSGGFNEALANQLVDAALLVLSENPELVAHEDALQLIIRDVASALAASGLERPDLLPELIRLTLESTAAHLHRLFGMEETPPRHLLVLALKQLLKAIAQKPNEGKWKPRLSNEQILEIADVLFDAVLENPRWAEAEEQIFLLLEAIFRALECIPPAERLPYLVLRSIIDSALAAANMQRKLMATIQTADGPVQLRLEFSLQTLFISLYDENQDEEVAWQLSQGPVVSRVTDYFLMFVAATPANKKDIERARARISKAFLLWKKDFTQMLDDVLENLDTNP